MKAGAWLVLAARLAAEELRGYALVKFGNEILI